jgi:hypothetical protein
MLRAMAFAGLAVLLVGCAGIDGGETVASDPGADSAAGGGEGSAPAAAPKGGQGGAGAGADKSGTNPINFTYDLRLYSEYQWLNTRGDGNLNLSTLEFRMPIAGGDLQFRVKVPYQMVKADFDDDGSDDVDESGLGDVNFRLLAVPVKNLKKKFALAVGLETFLDTASEDALGTGTITLGPQVFGVFFKPFGGLVDLIAPAYQHRISVHEDDDRSDVNQSLIDLFALKMSGDKQQWVLVNPTFVFDHENDTEFMLVDVEVGTMLDQFFGTSGHSIYLRPGFMVGGDRPADFSVELGYKIVW